jgi:XTP/dITP diphosphohydrolase
MNLIFASNNPHKLIEVKEIVNEKYNILSLHDAGIEQDIKETSTTLEGNAQIKAAFVFDQLHQACFADDTGLEVFALDMMPGVRSARYAGPAQNSSENLKKLMRSLHGVTNRKARFRTVICLILQGKPYFFEGIVEGKIGKYPSGTGGFGYDPVFIPDGHQCSFAGMSENEKNQISHRARAIKKMANFLNQMKL